jgi:hypothetical protein
MPRTREAHAPEDAIEVLGNHCQQSQQSRLALGLQSLKPRHAPTKQRPFTISRHASLPWRRRFSLLPVQRR